MVFMVHGHPWQEEPYLADSTKIGFNPLSQTQGAQQAGVGQKFDLLFPSAGGENRISGDYLYTTYQTGNDAGTWGLFQVTDSTVTIEKAVIEGGFAQASGIIKAATDRAPLPKQLRASLATDAGDTIELGTAPVEADGRWALKVASDLSAPARIQVTAIGENGQAGASATATISGPPPAEKLVTQSDQGASSGSP
jgi:manganese oxidase